MINRTRSILATLFISALAASCAQGASVLPSLGDAGASNGSTSTPVCGNGQIETGEMCECEAGSTDDCKVLDKDCSALMQGTGPLMCDHAMCVYIDSACSSNSGGNGGAGGGGTSG